MILVVSKDEDFASVVAGLVQQELQYPCRVASSIDEAKPLFSRKIDLVITTEASEKFSSPAMVLTKQDAPIRVSKLLADISAQLQKSNINGSIAIGRYEFQPMLKRLSAGSKMVSLTDKETQLLHSMLEGGEKGVAKETLLKDVWGFEPDMDTHTLETHIYRLRTKFRELGEEQAIIAVENGYALGIK